MRANPWTVGRRLAVGFGVNLTLTLLICAVASYSLAAAVSSKDAVISTNGENLIESMAMQVAIERRVAAVRGYLLTGQQDYFRRLEDTRNDFSILVDGIRARTDDPEQKRAISDMERANREHWSGLDKVVELKKSSAELAAIVREFDAKVAPRFEELRRIVIAFGDRETAIRDRAQLASTKSASTASWLIIAASVLAVVVAGAVSVFLTRALTLQVGAAVQQMQSASEELQSAATQLSSAAREQTSSIHETQTTMKELLTTSRQIGESSQHVARLARKSSEASGGGQGTVDRGQEAMATVRKQVDHVVQQMLDLSKKSQQIGGVLELINELSEQTNILAVNATIEAAGAGEAGLRFGAVAEEIRSLADRVGGSTREIRALVDEVRASINATVMATESGSKAVDASARQLEDITRSFAHITEMVSNTTEAAREIELSTNQQSSAVEQVDVAVSDVAQAARETEVSSQQVLQTANQLTTLSGELSLLIESNARS